MSDCWICSKCSWVNRASDAACKACGNSAPPGTTPSASAYPSERPPYNPAIYPSGRPPHNPTTVYPSGRPPYNPTAPPGPVHLSAPPPYNPAATVAQPHVVVTAQVVTGTPYNPSAPTAPTPTSESYAPTAPYAPSAPSSNIPVTSYAPAAPNAPAPLSNKEHWDCRACSWVNRITDGTCKACGRNAPPEIVPVVVAAPVALAHHSEPNVAVSIPNGPPAATTHQGSSYNDTAFSSGFNKPNNHHTTTSHISAPAPSTHISTAAPALTGAPAAPQKQQDNGFVSGFANHVPGRIDAPTGTTASRPTTATTTTTTYTSAPTYQSPPVAAVQTTQSSVFKIKEKFWGFGDDFVITTHDKTPVYKVKGKIFSFGDQLSFQDLNGRELAFISQKMFSFQPRYEIHRNGRLFARVVKEWTFFSQKFTLDVPGSNDYTIDGSFWEHDFTFRRQGRQVARVSKKYWSFSDSYGVEISPGEDEVSILCACIVIDQVLHDDN